MRAKDRIVLVGSKGIALPEYAIGEHPFALGAGQTSLDTGDLEAFPVRRGEVAEPGVPDFLIDDTMTVIRAKPDSLVRRGDVIVAIDGIATTANRRSSGHFLLWGPPGATRTLSLASGSTVTITLR
jgi:hypothetical protein